MYQTETFQSDQNKTLANRKRLFTNHNLMFWYENLFKQCFSDLDDLKNKKILEVGSGASPLKHFHKHVLTSDILNLDYLDIILDCHTIDKCVCIDDNSLDCIMSVNVLHHLANPLDFLLKASHKLKRGGCILLVEPYFSRISRWIYQNLHHEETSFEIREPTLKKARGPLTSANQAIPYLIFFGHRGWDEPLHHVYHFNESSVKHFSSLSYMITGGISRKIPIPLFIYKIFFKLDLKLSFRFPDLFSSFFILKLEKK